MSAGNDRKIVVVLGGSSGIGLAVAREHAGRGDHLVLASRSQQALDRAREQCVGAGAASALAIVADVCERPSLDGVVREALAIHDRVDVVVMASAVMAYGTLEQLPAEIFEQVVATDVFGTVNVARAFLPVLRRQQQGVLIVINSVVGSVVVPGMGAYAVAKWGQLAVARTLQQETRRDRNVHVCVVSPGSVNTPIYYQGANALGRNARPPWPVRQPEDVARVIADLADRPRRSVSMRVGATNPLIVAGFRLLPRVYDLIVGPLFQRLALERGATPHTAGNVHDARPDGERVRGRWPEPQ